MSAHRVRSSLKSLVAPVLVIATIGGVIQDLLIPLAEFGATVGFIFIVASIFLFMIPADRGPGKKLKELTAHWKFPIVLSFAALGVMLIVLTQISANYKDEQGFIASKSQTVTSLQRDMLGLDTSVTALEEAADESYQISEENKQTTAKIAEQTRRTAREELQRKGGDLNQRRFLLNVQNTPLTALPELMKLYKSAGLNLNKPFEIFGNVELNAENNMTIGKLPGRTNMAHLLIIAGVAPERLAIVRDAFPEFLSNRSPVNEYYMIDTQRSHMDCDAHIEPFYQHPAGFCDTYQMGGPYGISLISYRQQQPLDNRRGDYTLLHTAVVLNAQPQINWLLEQDLNINAQSISGYTPLALAIEAGHLQLSKNLLNKGADPMINEGLAIEVALIKARYGDAYHDALHSYDLSSSGMDDSVFEPASKTASNNTFVKLAKKMLADEQLPNPVYQHVEHQYQRILKHISGYRSQPYADEQRVTMLEKRAKSYLDVLNALKES